MDIIFFVIAVTAFICAIAWAMFSATHLPDDEDDGDDDMAAASLAGVATGSFIATTVPLAASIAMIAPEEVSLVKPQEIEEITPPFALIVPTDEDEPMEELSQIEEQSLALKQWFYEPTNEIEQYKGHDIFVEGRYKSLEGFSTSPVEHEANPTPSED